MNNKIITTSALILICLFFSGCNQFFNSENTILQSIYTVCKEQPEILEEVEKKYLFDIEKSKIKINRTMNQYKKIIESLMEDINSTDNLNTYTSKKVTTWLCNCNTGRITIEHKSVPWRWRNGIFWRQPNNTKRLISNHNTARKLHEKLNKMKLACENIQKITNQTDSKDDINNIVSYIIILKSNIICIKKLIPNTEKIDKYILSEALYDYSSYNDRLFCNDVLSVIDSILDESLSVIRRALINVKEINFDIFTEQLEIDITQYVDDMVNKFDIDSRNKALKVLEIRRIEERIKREYEINRLKSEFVTEVIVPYCLNNNINANRKSTHAQNNCRTFNQDIYAPNNQTLNNNAFKGYATDSNGNILSSAPYSSMPEPSAPPMPDNNCKDKSHNYNNAFKAYATDSNGNILSSAPYSSMPEPSAPPMPDNNCKDKSHNYNKNNKKTSSNNNKVIKKNLKK